jgi:hypothetical protein
MPSSALRSRSYGRISRIVGSLDDRRGAFFIARLIMTTGIKLRGFGPMMPDDPVVLERLKHGLRSLVPPEEFDELSRLFVD